jgi:ABC-type sugar transport system ATPase subunit
MSDPSDQFAVRLRGLTKRYGQVTAVDGIDLDIREGELLTLLGPSGSGKTTTLRMVAGFELPSEGTIELGGVEVTNRPPYERDVNTVFQDYALFPHMSVAENVGYGLRVRKVARRKPLRRGGVSRNTNSRITLYTGNTYFKHPDLPWPGTFRPFNDYAGHIDILLLYTLDLATRGRAEDLELIV